MIIAHLILIPIVQTWLLTAQIFCTREFAQLAVQRVLPRFVPWFTILIIPVGFAVDGTTLQFSASVGIMGVLYTSLFSLRSKTWEGVVSAATIELSLIGIDLWKFGMTPRVLVYALALAILMIAISLALHRWPSTIGMVIGYTVSIFVESLISLHFGVRYNNVITSILTAIMSGMYVNYRSFHEKVMQDTHQAVQYDTLTNALTRRGLANWVERCKSKGENEGVIIFCDLDNFKWINDTWGHEVGDRVLQEFVNRIRQGLRANDVIARFGGDEFQIWIPMKDSHTAENIVQRLHTFATQEVYSILPNGNGINIGVSMGGTYGPFSEEKAFEADFALLSAKKMGKNRVIMTSSFGTKEIHSEHGKVTDPHLYWLSNIAQALWSRVHYPFVLTDKSGRILMTNEAYEHLVGRTFEELRGNKPGMNSAHKTPDKVYKSMWSNLSNGNPWSGCLLNRREDGTEWWELSELFPIVISGQIVGYWGLVQELKNGKFSNSPVRSDYKWHGEIEWAFQPIVDTYSQDVIGFEALARPTWGNEAISPDTFFRIAETFDFTSQADWMCMESLLDKLQTIAWPMDVRLFLNVYARTFENKEKMRFWLERFYQAFPQTVCVFEILEHHVDTIDVVGWNNLKREFPLIELAQDDFGIGEKDLIRLTEAKPNWVKLDRYWIKTMSEHPESKILLQGIVDWTTSEGIKLIVEGIETLNQSQALVGIQYEQGYFWSTPQKEPVFSLSHA